jgi:hypothetical protein
LDANIEGGPCCAVNTAAGSQQQLLISSPIKSLLERDLNIGYLRGEATGISAVLSNSEMFKYMKLSLKDN